jgi:hypothetical protein
MKELHGRASATVPAPAADCFVLLLDVESYPSWYAEVVRSVRTMERDAGGAPTLAATTVHFGLGPLARDFDLVMTITSEQDRSVRLTRVRHDSADPEELSLHWQIDPGQPTELALELVARLDVPRLVPLTGLGDAVAQGFVEAAQRQLHKAEH